MEKATYIKKILFYNNDMIIKPSIKSLPPSKTILEIYKYIIYKGFLSCIFVKELQN